MNAAQRLALALRRGADMTRSELRFALRLFALSTALILPLLGCIGPSAPPPPPDRCGAVEMTWSPDRIELLDMADEVSVEEDAEVGIVSGGQGSDMAGFYIVLHGDGVPSCVPTTISLGDEVQSEGWVYEADASGGRAQLTNPVYWVEPERGPVTVTVSVGETTATFDVDVF
jgi:hypothetical protein